MSSNVFCTNNFKQVNTPTVCFVEWPSASWTSIACFKVTYQTRHVAEKPNQQVVIHHVETGAIGRWLDFEDRSIPQWLHEQVEATLPPKAKNPVIPEITQLKVIQPHLMGCPMIVDESHLLLPEAIQTDEPFALDVSMQFPGLPETQQDYQIQCTVRDLSTGSTAHLGHVTTHVPSRHHSEYKVLLSGLMLPHPGIYRLKVFITPQHAPEPLAYFKIPMLQSI